MLGELRDTDAASDRSSVTGDINVFHRCHTFLPEMYAWSCCRGDRGAVLGQKQWRYGMS